MTDKLRDAMNAQAGSAGFTPPDLDAITGAGQRTVRRRRTAVGAAAVAGLAAAVALAVTLTGPGTEKTAIDPAVPTVQYRDLDPIVVASDIVYVGPDAQGRTATTTLEDPVDRLVRNADAFVYQTGRDFDTGVADIRGWAGGVTTDLGTGSDLAIDLDGHLAAWIQPGRTVNRLQVLDTRTMTRTSLDLVGTERPRLHDVDDGVVYVDDARGGVAIDVATGAATAVENYVVDVENGVVVAATPEALDEEKRTDGYVVADGLIATVDGRQTRLTGTRSGALSPDGRWFATSDPSSTADADKGAKVDAIDTATGVRTTMDIAGAIDVDLLAAEPIGWLDVDTLTVYVSGNTDEIDRLLSCDVPSGDCVLVVPDVAELIGEKENDIVTYPGGPPFDRR